jgi:hypothetical protein
VLSDDELLAIAPPGSGVVDVTVTTPQGTSATGSNDRFVYSEGPPGVITGEATGVHYEEATLNASVDPIGAVSECRFEYGTTPAYGSSVACSSLPEAGERFVPVSATLSNLQSNTTYYFRAVATNANGTSYGAQKTFSTVQLPELGRCEEMSGAASGKYSDSHCTTPSPGEDSGGYEWLPGPGAGSAFTGAGGAFTVERRSLRRRGNKTVIALDCSASSLAGAYNGGHEVLLTLTLTGCNDDGFSANSPEAASGEIIARLHGELQTIAGAKSETGVKLANIEGEHLLSYEVHFGEATVNEHVTGSVAATLKSTDKMSRSFSLTSKPSKSSLYKEDGFKTKWTIANGEPLEVKSSA